ncbi:hypothetical protein LINPERPRIM_LOCUS459 [Linum perenne]
MALYSLILIMEQQVGSFGIMRGG